MLRKERLSITSVNGETMETILERRGKLTYRKEIEDILYNLLDVSMQKDESYIPHPVSTKFAILNKSYFRFFLLICRDLCPWMN